MSLGTRRVSDVSTETSFGSSQFKSRSSGVSWPSSEEIYHARQRAACKRGMTFAANYVVRLLYHTHIWQPLQITFAKMCLYISSYVSIPSACNNIRTAERNLMKFKKRFLLKKLIYCDLRQNRKTTTKTDTAYRRSIWRDPVYNPNPRGKFPASRIPTSGIHDDVITRPNRRQAYGTYVMSITEKFDVEATDYHQIQANGRNLPYDFH
jgi:hypothetical protein